jgi:HAMP domain-containing protein
MTGYPLHLLGLIAIALWIRLRPKLELKALFLYWWVGLLLMRIVPMVLVALLGRSGHNVTGTAPGLLLGLCMWAGAALFFRALLGFCTYQRSRSVLVRIAGGAFLFSIVLGGQAPGWVDFVLSLLSVPFALSLRWRTDLSAKPLVLANLTALVTVAALAVQFGDPVSPVKSVAAGLIGLQGPLRFLGFLYALLVLPATATRIHLSIRRIGARLVSSHLLAGIFPAGLLLLFLLIGSALYLSTYRSSLGVHILASQSEAARRQLSVDLAALGRVEKDPFGSASSGVLLVARRDDGPVESLEGTPSFSPDSLLALEQPSRQTPFLYDGRTLYTRARLDTLIAGVRWRVEALAPVDSLRMTKISEVVGAPVLVNPFVSISRAGGGVQIYGADGEEPEEGAGTGKQKAVNDTIDLVRWGNGSPGKPAAGDTSAFRAGSHAIGPAKRAGLQLPGGATAPVVKWKNGKWSSGSVLVSSSAGLGEQLLSLFSISKDNPMATVALFALAFIAILLLGAIWVVIAMVIGMGRSVTNAVAALTEATGALREGKLDHRIQVQGNDELWSVAGSFNEMAVGLEKMRELEIESDRREEELRLARAIQDRLLPSGPPLFERAELAGISLPAREVGGDYFDYLILEGGLIGLAVADVSGKGAPAAMLMSTFRASLRSQDLKLLGPAEVLGRVNRFIHDSIDTGKFITAFLGLLDPATGEFRYANAGHDAPLLIGPDGSTAELTGGGLILGLLPQIVYEEAVAQLAPGSLVAIFTDGITEARDPQGEFYGTERLLQVLQAPGQVPCGDLLRRVVDSIHEFSATGPQSDDITLMLLRRR